MPSLDRRLLAWSDDSDTEDNYDDRLLATPRTRGLAADDGVGSYDRAPAAVDDVLVPPGGADDAGGRAGAWSSKPGTRKALAVAGLIAGGCLCAYLAWRCCGSMGKMPGSS